MFKIVIRSFNLFKFIKNISLINKFFFFDIRSLNSINDVHDFSYAISVFSTESKHGKTTSSNRFSDLDTVTIKFLSLQDVIKIHDVAVSSGITSCELLNRVEGLNKPYQFKISDKYVNYFSSGNRIVRIYNSEKKLLYGYFFNVLADENLSNYYALSKFLYFLLKGIPYPNKFHAMQLFDVETKKNLKDNKFKYVEYDLFGINISDNNNFVRCMNVLNAKSWFSEEQIITGIANLKSSLIEGGILLIGRTDDFSNQNNASFFVKRNDKLLHLEDFNSGSDIKTIIKNHF